ncbi:MAG TPA: ABC transporter permease [Vicinamibacterales bacterium]|nr:ABC transporter permease [Vicinamibacterales bacterium]
MSVVAEWWRRLSYLVNRTRVDAALREEMDAHREMLADPRRFGNPLRMREDAHAVWGWTWLDDLGRDVRYAARTLLRTPGFTAVVIVSLALATGATTAIFSIVNSVLLRPLPFAQPDRLVQVYEIHRTGGAGAVSFPDVQAFRAESTLFERFSGYELTTRFLDASDGVERLMGVVTDLEFFALLGVAPIAGRTFGAGDPANVVVISESFWERRFNRDPSVIGRTMIFSGNRWDAALRRSIIQRRELTVLGVMPARFQFPYGASAGFDAALPEARTDIWIPDERVGGGRFGSMTARLKPGVTIDAARQELDAIRQRVDISSPGPYRPTGVQIVALEQEVLGAVYRSLWLLFGAVGLVLAAACANVANLLLARTSVRTHEVVTRVALGAAPGRLLRQFLAESLLLALAGGACGAAIAKWGVDLLASVGAAKIPRAHEVVLDWRTFAFLLLVCVVAAIVFGLAPALIASRTDAHTITRESNGRVSASARHNRARDALVVVEVALAFILAFGAGGVMRELGRLSRIDAGMKTAGVITLHLSPRIPDRDYYTIEARVRQMPGVEAAGFTQMVPLQNWGWLGDIGIRGRPREYRPTVELRTITPGYFDALGIPVRGRPPSEGDAVGPARAIVVNEAFARQTFPGADPIGAETDRGFIVGVAGDVRQARLDRPAVPEIYQVVNRDAGVAPDLGMTLMVRAAGPPESIVPAIRAAAREINPAVAIFNVKTMDRVVADSLWELNLYRWIVGLFAALALVLAGIGLYGVIAYSVTSRTREFAVRLALGAEPAALARAVLRRGIGLAVVGLVLGGAAALSLLPLLDRLPARVNPDLPTFAAIAALLVVLAALACLVPAIRVTAVNPSSALRTE